MVDRGSDDELGRMGVSQATCPNQCPCHGCNIQGHFGEKHRLSPLLNGPGNRDFGGGGETSFSVVWPARDEAGFEARSATLLRVWISPPLSRCVSNKGTCYF